MNSLELPLRHIVVGENGRFSREFIRQMSEKTPPSEIVNVSTRNFSSHEFMNQLHKLLATHNTFSDIIYWSSGSASNRSGADECRRDKASLVNFINLISTIDNYRPKFCYLSSGGTVYGKSPGLVHEDTPLNPESHYAEMKVASEELLCNQARMKLLTLNIFRVANVYGLLGLNSRQSLIEAALRKDEINISVHLDSRKQYGTYGDYVSYILGYLEFNRENQSQVTIQNTFSPHEYSVGEILRITHGKNPTRRVIENGDDISPAPYESAILSTRNQVKENLHNWISLEEYVETVG